MGCLPFSRTEYTESEGLPQYTTSRKLYLINCNRLTTIVELQLYTFGNQEQPITDGRSVNKEVFLMELSVEFTMNFQNECHFCG